MICPNCKTKVPEQSEQSQTIEILESQVRQLSQKLAFAVDKAADLEDDLRALRSASPAPSVDPPFLTTQSRLSSFLAARRPSLFSSKTNTPTKPVTRASTPNPNLPLDEQLSQERATREAAEEKVASMSLELEELTQSLFEEANAMVKSEREKCARLEGRLQILESREEDKRRRLSELEKAIGRITRVRSLLEGQVAVK